MKLTVELNDKDLWGKTFPRWYGVAYRKVALRRTVLAIIPFNLFIRYGSQIYWLFYIWLHSGGWKNRLDDAYWRGFNDGNTEEHDFERLAHIIREEIVRSRGGGVSRLPEAEKMKRVQK